MNYELTVLKENDMGNINDFEEKFRICLKDYQLAATPPEALVLKGLCCEERFNAILLFSLAVYIRKDYLPALFHRALVYYDSGNYDLALMDIRHCRDLDLDDPVYERWENLINDLVHATHESDR